MNEMNEIAAQVLPIGNDLLVLPNGVVAEILRQVSLKQADEGSPDWLLGSFSWQGMDVPLISFARLSGRGMELDPGRKCVVIKTLDPGASLACYALAIDAFPQFVGITRQGLLLDASMDEPPRGVRAAVLVGGKTGLVPDLGQIEALLGQLRVDA